MAHCRWWLASGIALVSVLAGPLGCAPDEARFDEGCETCDVDTGDVPTPSVTSLEAMRCTVALSTIDCETVDSNYAISRAVVRANDTEFVAIDSKFLRSSWFSYDLEQLDYHPGDVVTVELAGTHRDFEEGNVAIPIDGAIEVREGETATFAPLEAWDVQVALNLSLFAAEAQVRGGGVDDYQRKLKVGATTNHVAVPAEPGATIDVTVIDLIDDRVAATLTLRGPERIVEYDNVILLSSEL